MSNLSINRSKNYWRQVKSSMMFKVGAVVLSFSTLPYTITFLGDEAFGIWATMLTLLSWIMLFDIGIGSSLRNKITESLSQQNYKSASVFVSTAYISISCLSIMLFVFFSVISIYIPWDKVFNTSKIEESTLHLSVLLLTLFILSNFILSLISQVCHGLQKSSVTVFGQFISNASAFIFVVIANQFFDSSLTLMVAIYGISLLVSNAIISIIVFREFPQIIPRLSFFSVRKVSELLNLGIRFFAIQLSVLFIFMTDKILITQLLGPSAVVSYEVLYKLFSIFTLAHVLILTPIWSAYTDAFSRNDFRWIKRQIIRQLIIASSLSIGALAMYFVGPFITKIWIADTFYADSSTYFMFSIFIIISVWNNVFAYYVNSISKTNVQFITAVIGAILNIPLSIVFVKYQEFGVDGIILSTILCLSIYSVVGPIEVYKHLKNRESL